MHVIQARMNSCDTRESDGGETPSCRCSSISRRVGDKHPEKGCRATRMSSGSPLGCFSMAKWSLFLQHEGRVCLHETVYRNP